MGEWILKALFYRVTLFFGAQWDKDVLAETATVAYSQYSWMSLAELKLFEVKLKGGAFGKQYHKLSPAEAMGHLATFSVTLEDARAGLDRVVSKKSSPRPFINPKRFTVRYDLILRFWYHVPLVSDEMFQALRKQIVKEAAEGLRRREEEAAERQRQKTAQRKKESEAAMRQWCSGRGIRYEDYLERMEKEKQEQMTAFTDHLTKKHMAIDAFCKAKGMSYQDFRRQPQHTQDKLIAPYLKKSSDTN